MALKDDMQGILKEMCHFAAEDGVCEQYAQCKDTDCTFAGKYTSQILVAIKSYLKPIDDKDLIQAIESSNCYMRPLSPLDYGKAASNIIIDKIIKELSE